MSGEQNNTAGVISRLVEEYARSGEGEQIYDQNGNRAVSKDDLVRFYENKNSAIINGNVSALKQHLENADMRGVGSGGVVGDGKITEAELAAINVTSASALSSDKTYSASQPSSPYQQPPQPAPQNTPAYFPPYASRSYPTQPVSHKYPDGSMGHFAETHENSGLMFGALGGLLLGIFSGEGFSMFAMLIGGLLGTYFVDGENGAVGKFFNKITGGGSSPSLGGHSPNIQTSQQQGQAVEGGAMPAVYNRQQGGRFHQMTRDDADNLQTTFMVDPSNGQFVTRQVPNALVVYGKIVDCDKVQITNVGQVGKDGQMGKMYPVGEYMAGDPHAVNITIPAPNGVIDAENPTTKQALNLGLSRVHNENLWAARDQAKVTNASMVTGGHDAKEVSAPNCHYEGATEVCSVRL